MKTPSIKTLSIVQLVALAVLAASVLILALFSINAQVALCAFKGDLNSRIRANETILEQFPSQDPIIRAFGLQIPRSVIENNLRGQRQTYRSLDGLLC